VLFSYIKCTLVSLTLTLIVTLPDIEAMLRTKEYSRLRVGISGPGRRDLADHVLGQFTSSEQVRVRVRVRARVRVG
jgi:peptidyl-tRNA hydrolase